MHIRLATADEMPQVQGLLLELSVALNKPGEIQGDESDLRRFGFGEHPFFQAMLAFDREQAVGMVVFFPEYSTWRGVPGVYVQDLYVKPGYRTHGLGRKLLQAVRDHAANWGGRYIKLTVYDRDPGAIAFYRKLGFESCEDELPLVLRY